MLNEMSFWMNGLGGCQLSEIDWRFAKGCLLHRAKVGAYGAWRFLNPLGPYKLREDTAARVDECDVVVEGWRGDRPTVETSQRSVPQQTIAILAS